jgi:PKD repeat protein
MEGDSFNWTIQCSNGQSGNANGASNGTKTLTISNLAYLKTYKVWVNATDPTGSGNYTRKYYSFTTRKSDQGPPPEPPEPNKNPVADMSAGEPYQGYVNSEITFDGSRSYDPDGNISKWFWVFGDNTNGTGKIVSHIYTKTGTYTVILTVIDNVGATNTDTTKCMISQVNNRPPTKPFITGPITGTKNTIYTYTAVSTDADNNTLQYTFDWGDLISTPQLSGFLPNGSGFTQSHSWEAAGRYDVIVTVTDNQTESSSNIIVYIDAVQARQVGYLLDNNSDGTYDAFYSDELKQITKVEKKDDGYLIDSDGDGDTDYHYNTAQGLTAYTEPEKTPGFELIIVIGAIALVFLWKRKRIVHD